MHTPVNFYTRQWLDPRLVLGPTADDVLSGMGWDGMRWGGGNNEPFVTTFFVCPAVFAVLMLNTITNAALYGPVR